MHDTLKKITKASKHKWSQHRPVCLANVVLITIAVSTQAVLTGGFAALRFAVGGAVEARARSARLGRHRLVRRVAR